MFFETLIDLTEVVQTNLSQGAIGSFLAVWLWAVAANVLIGLTFIVIVVGTVLAGMAVVAAISGIEMAVKLFRRK